MQRPIRLHAPKRSVIDDSAESRYRPGSVFNDGTRGKCRKTRGDVIQIEIHFDLRFSARVPPESTPQFLRPWRNWYKRDDGDDHALYPTQVRTVRFHRQNRTSVQGPSFEVDASIDRQSPGHTVLSEEQPGFLCWSSGGDAFRAPPGWRVSVR